MQKSILEMLENYKKHFPQDVDVLPFFEYLNNPENNNRVVNRKNFNGHITVSALVINSNKVLVLWHKTFQKYMQPGGHIDPPDKNIFDAIIREVKEETGLDVEKTDGIFSEIPLSVDAHPIEANEKKNEDAHIHFDICFLLKLKNENQEIINSDEGVDDAKWIDLKDINEGSNFVLFKAVEKYKAI